MTDKKMDKISKLLAQAEGTDNPHEAETFMQQAQHLATMYEIDLEMARQAVENRDQRAVPITMTVEIGEKGNRGGGAYTDLFYVIAQVNGIECIMWNHKVDCYGFKQDIEYTETLYSFIVVQMVSQCMDYLEEGSWRGETSKTEARKSFYESYRKRIAARLREAKKDAIRESDQNTGGKGALVLVEKDREVKSYFWDNAPRVGYRSPTRGTHHASKGAGDRAARNAKLRSDPEMARKKELG